MACGGGGGGWVVIVVVELLFWDGCWDCCGGGRAFLGREEEVVADVGGGGTPLGDCGAGIWPSEGVWWEGGRGLTIPTGGGDDFGPTALTLTLLFWPGGGAIGAPMGRGDPGIEAGPLPPPPADGGRDAAEGGSPE